MTDGNVYTARNGFFGEVVAGDYLLDENNQPVKVLEDNEPHVPERMFRVYDEEGNSVDVSGTHLWYVVSQGDKEFHRERVAFAEQVLAPRLVDVYVRKTLESWAEDTFKSGDILETTVMDVVALLFNDDEVDPFAPEVAPVVTAVKRVAQSVGPVAENHFTYQDMAFTDETEKENIFLYDARQIAQQILAIAGTREQRKQWNVRIGRVVTTVDMFTVMEFGGDVFWIPDAPDKG